MRTATRCAILTQLPVAFCAGMTENSAPVAGLTNIQALALGEDHACAYTADGVTRCWGANAFSQLGIGVEGDPQYAPTPVAW